ncbi:uncharacterized protein LOC108040061 isoform X3 [Drosophila rhopaloa]|uniref:Uncharacterized protein n=1 Tax=Drosophila rhopaloa TaxID=1041015 RepID=A0ABM5JCK3_DRORH|nr:uncharacterized protein LOC108040061 isoform X3 [Drosophila rhopaloa]
MDSTSNTVEKVLETKNGTEELHADVLASEDNGNSVETPLELSSDSDLDKPNSRTDDIDDADLIIEDKESKNCSLKSENTDTVVEKPSIPVGSLDTDTTANTDEKESKDLNIEQSPVKTDTTITLENSVIANTKNEKPPIVSDDNQNVAVIKDENCIIVSTSNAENSSVPQGTSNIQVEDEDEEVQKTEKTVLQDCTENLTEEGIIETTSTKSELAGETTKPEVDLPIEHGIIETTNTTSDLAGETTKPEVDLPIEHNEFNNQILDIISDIDINIKAQEKITQLQEQELKLIRKQNELANQIQQQQILAQRLNANNQFKPSQGSQSANFDSQSQQQNKRDVLVSVTPQNTAGNETTNTSKTVDLRKIFTPATDSSEILPKNRKLYASSAFYSPTLHPTVEDQVELARRISHSLSDISNQTSKGQSMYVNRKKRSDKWVHEGRSQGNECSNDAINPYKENSDINSTLEFTNLEKIPLKLIMNPNGKVRDYNSLKELINVETGLLSPDNCAELITALQLHQGRGAELFAKRRKKAENWIVDETNAGTQNHPSGIPDYQQYQQKPILPNILPAYSDAGKHRVQLNLHQNQLIEKYSKPGLQVVKSPWEAALQTGSASSAFLEDNNSQCFSPAVTPTSYFHGGYNDIPDAEQPTHYTTQRQQQNVNPAPPQSINVPSNPKRDLAYTPCVAQGWGGHNVELPKESLQIKESESSWQTRPDADDNKISCVHFLYGDNLTSNFAVDVQNRLHELEKFQTFFLEHQRLENKILRNREYLSELRSTKLSRAYKNPSDIIPKNEFEMLRNDDQRVKSDTDDKVNVRDLIESFEQQNITELNQARQAVEPIENNEGLYVPKEISLSSYAAPPKQYGGHEENFKLPSYESLSRPLPMTNFVANENSITGSSEFPLTKPLTTGFSTLPPNQKPYSPYKKIPVRSECFAPQVNFNPSPLSFDKVAIFEQHDKRNLTGASPQYLNVQQNSQVRNTSPTPFGIAFNEQTSRSPSSLGSGGSPHLPKTGSSRCGPTSSSATPSLNQGQTFNKCARGWGPISHNQEVYQSPYSLPISGNLPYSDF